MFSASPQNNQSNPNKRPDRENQEGKREPNRTERQGCQHQRDQADMSSQRPNVRPIAHRLQILH